VYRLPLCKREYRSLALTCTKILRLRYLLHELQQKPQPIPTHWCNNIGATFLMANLMFHARTKPIEIDYHFVKEKVVSKQLHVKFLCSTDQLADIMTKPLLLPQFQTQSQAQCDWYHIGLRGCNKT
jgi:hypothetical protein